jgi:hypothetical protein
MITDIDGSIAVADRKVMRVDEQTITLYKACAIRFTKEKFVIFSQADYLLLGFSVNVCRVGGSVGGSTIVIKRICGVGSVCRISI